jgi:predicted metalloprotease with PDZ domain
MITYSLSSPHPSSQFIHISISFDVFENTTCLQLPSWRPGRYELGDFAKNIRLFNVSNEMGNQLTFFKISKDCWSINTEHSNRIHVCYEYYSNELNAGSSYVDENQLYVNPVNCCAYVIGRENEEILLKLDVPSDYKVATALTSLENNVFKAKDFDTLADSPFISSNSIQHSSYNVGATLFHIWFQGEIIVPWDIVCADFKSFTQKQIEKFGSFPVLEYHFLNQIVPHKAYHGVEHATSTVILLGPSFSVFNESYIDLLGVSSHELYHAWNVKSIRPIEMFPYDFSKENYSELGFIYEGVTTYMGDLFLLKSNVFSWDQYVIEFNQYLAKHTENEGRFNYSVAESSFDTWLDGYEPGAPGRKVSIYTEGCLLAFMADVLIIRATNGNFGLDEVMRRLYTDYYLAHKGVSKENYQFVLENVSGISFDSFFKDYIFGRKDYLPLLKTMLNELGLSLVEFENPKKTLSIFGIKLIQSGNHFIVKSIHSKSPAWNAGMMLEDEIIAINSFDCAGDIEKWIRYFENELIYVFLIKRKGVYLSIDVHKVPSDLSFFPIYVIQQNNGASHAQELLFKSWIS